MDPAGDRRGARARRGGARARAEIARATGAAGVRVTASAGVSELGPACTANDLVARADAALYAVKRAPAATAPSRKGPDGLARGAAVAALLVGDADRERLRSRALRDRATGPPSHGLVVAVDRARGAARARRAARPRRLLGRRGVDEGRLDGAEQRDVASLLLESARPGEVVAHVAGGRFGWVLPGADEERARATAGLVRAPPPRPARPAAARGRDRHRRRRALRRGPRGGRGARAAPRRGRRGARAPGRGRHRHRVGARGARRAAARRPSAVSRTRPSPVRGGGRPRGAMSAAYVTKL